MLKFFGSFLLLISTLIPQNSFAQTSQFQGQWSKVGTTYLFEFSLFLEHSDNNQVTGYFDWKVVRYNEKEAFSKAHYKKRIGLTAKEFVRGTYNPKTKEYKLRGYKKEDYHRIIALDSYRLKVDKNGDLGGDTKANGTWDGRINGSPKKDVVF